MLRRCPLASRGARPVSLRASNAARRRTPRSSHASSTASRRPNRALNLCRQCGAKRLIASRSHAGIIANAKARPEACGIGVVGSSGGREDVSSARIINISAHTREEPDLPVIKVLSQIKIRTESAARLPSDSRHTITTMRADLLPLRMSCAAGHPSTSAAIPASSD